jgi:predicted MFS family arabinose efflux permease
VMAVLSAMDLVTPWLLLVLTAAMGIGMILNQPAWQALTPELVPPALVPSAVAVGSISFNLARSRGPVLAGLLIAQFGVWATFSINAVSFLGVLAVLLVWNPHLEDASQRASPEFFNELRKGMFVVGNSSELRNTLLRLLVFATSASILWSLLALVATEKLGFQERGFGACLGLIGVGAVTGAWFLPRIRSQFSSEAIVLSAQGSYAAILLLIGLCNSATLILPGLVFIGAAWMTTMTTLNATTQVNLPRKFRARGMASFLMALALGMAIGSAVWGWLAYGQSLSVAFVVAGLTMAVTSAAMHQLKIGSLRVAADSQ